MTGDVAKTTRVCAALVATTVLILQGDARLEAARLRAESIAGWQRYVAAVEARRVRDGDQSRRFFVMDTGPDGAAERRALARGEFVVREMEASDAAGRAIDVPGALVHHWRGAVLLRGAALPEVLRRLEADAPRPGRDILRSTVLARGVSTMKVYLRLERSKVVTVVLDTEHDVRFFRLSPTQAASVSVATRIAEVEAAGRPGERRLPPGDDRGFLWRLNSYWRYGAVPEGVIAECESVSLSRGVPFGLQTIAGPLIGSAARESMERALEGLREQVKN